MLFKLAEQKANTEAAPQVQDLAWFTPQTPRPGERTDM